MSNWNKAIVRSIWQPYCQPPIAYCLIGFALLLALAPPVHAAETIRIIVPFAAGGPTEMMARLIAQEMAGPLGVNIVVDPRGGAGGILGTDLAAHAAPDGKTLLVATMGSQVITSALHAHPGYDPIKSFEPIVLMGGTPSLLAVNKDLPVKTFPELIALAKTRKITYGTAGPGTTMHIAGEMLNAGAGIKLTHVPYRGEGPALVDVIAGHVDLMIASPPVLLPHIANGSIRLIALFDRERMGIFPDVPTTTELGYPDLIMKNWYGVLAPAGVPEAELARLEQAVLAALQTPIAKERMAAGNLSGTLGRQAFKARLLAETAFWEPLVKRLGITAE